MKYWDMVINRNLTFEAATNLAQYGAGIYFMTRPEWDGVHFYNRQGVYCILFKDGHVEIDMLDKAWDKDKNDWMVVTLSTEGYEILIQNKQLCFSKEDPKPSNMSFEELSKYIECVEKAASLADIDTKDGMKFLSYLQQELDK
jgi:hypothetical protein